MFVLTNILLFPQMNIAHINLEKVTYVCYTYHLDPGLNHFRFLLNAASLVKKCKDILNLKPKSKYPFMQCTEISKKDK